jgi:hypothetical protein
MTAALELVGSERKRWVIVESIRTHVERTRQAAAADRTLPPAEIAPPWKAGSHERRHPR